MTNVRAMFYQVRETDEDKDFLGFLRRPDTDVTRDIIELRMNLNFVYLEQFHHPAVYALLQ